MNYLIETERLLLREPDLNDTAFILQLLNSPGWLMFIGDRNVKTEEQAKDYLLNGPMKSYRANGFGLSVVELKPTKVPIGLCGLIKRDDLKQPDIGYAYLPEYWGEGYAIEMAHAVMTFAKVNLNLDEILGVTTPSNSRSIKILEKIGLRFIRNYHMPGKEELLFLYSNRTNIENAPEE